MPIRHWPRGERPREKLLQAGPTALSDAELLALFLGSGRPGSSAVDLAREQLAACGGLRCLLDITAQQYCARPGLGPASFARLQGALELGRRYLESTLARNDVLNSPRHTRDFLMARLRAYPHEVFACLFLDNRHRLICFEELFRGTIDGASVHPREVVKRALHHNAAALIIAHNHPSGVAEPSLADQNITGQLKQSLALVEIRLLDHVIIGDGEAVSMAERGLV